MFARKTYIYLHEFVTLPATAYTIVIMKLGILADGYPVIIALATGDQQLIMAPMEVEIAVNERSAK